MILLDTNAVIWLVQRHARAQPLLKLPRLFVSPATLLELQFLEESGRLRAAAGRAADLVAHDPRWRIDDVSSRKLFEAAGELAWTRDPFDRLIVAHAQVKGWKLATGDTRLIDRLAGSDVVPL